MTITTITSDVNLDNIDTANTITITIPPDITTYGAGTIGSISYGAGTSFSSSMWNGSYNYTTSSITPNSGFYTASGQEVARIPSNEATLEVTGRIKMNGEYLDERLERIETLLSIPTRNVKIEEQYPKLKELYDQYMHELEKCKTWNRIKKGSEE